MQIQNKWVIYVANIQKRGKNSYRLIVEAGYDVKGNRLRRTKTVNVSRMGDAEKELAKFQVEVESKEYIAPEKFIFGAFVKEWQSKFVEKQLAGKTIQNYLHHAQKRIEPYFGHLRMDKIKTLHIVQFLDELQAPGMRRDGKEGVLSPASVVYVYRVLRSIFTKAMEWKVIKDNPMIGAQKPKEPELDEMETYTEEEVSLLFEALQDEPQKFNAMIVLAFTTGMRRGELLGLEWEHVDLEGGLLEVKQSIAMRIAGIPEIKSPKNKSSKRLISLPVPVIEQLRELQSATIKERENLSDLQRGDGHTFVFCNEFGESYAPKTFSDWWRSFHKRILSKLDLKYIRFHDIRHTSASLLINQNVHAKIISKRLGHAKIGTTMNIYGHVFRSADRAAADTFGALFKSKKGTT